MTLEASDDLSGLWSKVTDPQESGGSVAVVITSDRTDHFELILGIGR